MGRIRSREQREAEERERVAAVARALMEAEPADALRRIVALHVSPRGEQLPRIPVIGMEPGAIRGTSPHAARIDIPNRRVP